MQRHGCGGPDQGNPPHAWCRNMAGVISCRTTYAQFSNQCICNLVVAEDLASVFEACGRILSGRVGHLTFKLRSGDNDGTTEEPMHVDKTVPPTPKTIILPTQCDALLDDSSANGRETSVHSNLLDSSNTTLTPNSPGGARQEVSQTPWVFNFSHWAMPMRIGPPLTLHKGELPGISQ